VEPFRDIDGKKVAPLAVANIVLAEIEGADDSAVGKLAANARDDMQRFWKEGLAQRVRNNCGGLLAGDASAVWDEQTDTFLEFAAAWSAVASDGKDKDPYKAARKRLNKAIAARKNLRDFEPWQKDRKGKPKSSLDGARVSVLKDKEERPANLLRKYRLGENEQLDAVGLVKRAGGETEQSRASHDLQFVPIFNVALAPWMKAAKDEHEAEFKAVDTAVRVKQIDWPRVARDIPCGPELFGFDASIFLRSRWWPEFKELGIFAPPGLQDEKDKAKRETLEREWRRIVEDWCFGMLGPKRGGNNPPPRILDLMSEPYPYVACLAADGDGMGGAIDALGSAEEHRAFSRELAKFAREARAIVEGEAHLGSLVYSGGDDVLAFLPVSTALQCACKLRHVFASIMERARTLPGGGLSGGLPKLPTLSVGIGIGHVMESMGDLLDLGRRAEKAAKGGHLKAQNKDGECKDRNALAIILDKRSGGTRTWRQQWPQEPIARLDKDRMLLSGEDKVLAGKRLSSRKVYQIADIVRRLPEPRPAPKAEASSGDELADFKPVLFAEVKRTLKRIDGGGGGSLALEEVGLAEIESAFNYASMHSAVSGWVDRLLIARAFAESEPKLKNDTTNTEAAA
jgi:CRISPR-associated protein Cmr2